MPIADEGLAAQVFGRRTDMWTNRALDLFARNQIACGFVDLDAAPGPAVGPGGGGVLEALIRETRHYQTPYVFMAGQFVGGFAELDERERLGQLFPETSRPGRTRVVIAERAAEFVPPAAMPLPVPVPGRVQAVDDADHDDEL